MSDFENRNAWPGWKTVHLIGRGSFGAVYEIERDNYGHKERAALKVISIPQSASDIDDLMSDGYDEESITSRFEGYMQDIVREYSLMADMKGCANIVYCDDWKSIKHDDGMGWDIFIKMELLTALPRALGKTVTDEQVVKIGSDICSALVFCEKRNLLHRDIKPQNIFIAPDGTYKLGDFGIAKTAERTTSGTKTGTYKYMAPEVYNNQPYGGKADIYSLGLVLYWLLNERRTPFLPLPPAMPTATEEDSARARRFNGEPVPAPANGSKELQRIVLKACAFDPNDRYQSAEEMLRELEMLGGSAHTTGSISSCQSAMSTDFGRSDNDATVSALHPTPKRREAIISSKQSVDGQIDSSATAANRLDQQGTEEDETIGAFDSKSTHVPKASTYITDSATSHNRKRSHIWIALCVVAVAVTIIALIKGHSVIQPIETPNPTSVAQVTDNAVEPTETPNVIVPANNQSPTIEVAQVTDNAVEPTEMPNVIVPANNQSPTISTVLKSINSDQKIGFLIARDENAPVDLLFIQGCEEICLAQGIPYIIKTGVWADNIYKTALELVDSGCTIIFSNNSNNEDYLIQAAKQCPDVVFWQAYGDKETEVGIDNYHCAEFIYGDEDANTEISVVVVHSNNTSNKLIIRTNQTYLGAALRDLWLISGEESQYGFFVTTVDSEFADSSKQQWWCLTHNGEIAQTDVDDTVLISGDEYGLELVTGW